MTELLLAPTPDNTVVRDQWGRPVIDGRTFTRVSTIAGLLDSKDNLMTWYSRTTLAGVAMRPDLASRAFAHRGDDNMIRALAKEAFELGGGKRGAGVGTALHSLSCEVDLGQLDTADIPDEGTRADVEAYLSARHAEKLEVAGAEFFVVDRHLGIAGTPDRLYCETPDGALVLGDLKTSRGETKWLLGPTAIQLAAYAGGVPCAPDGTELGWPDRFDPSRGYLVHAPQGSGRCAFIPLDLDTAREGLTLALGVREWRARDAARLMVINRERWN